MQEQWTRDDASICDICGKEEMFKIKKYEEIKSQTLTNNENRQKDKKIRQMSPRRKPEQRNRILKTIQESFLK